MTLSGLLEEKKRKRRHPRTKMRKVFLVAWQGGGRRGASRARNVCLGGIYIDTRNPADEGEILDLFFDTPQHAYGPRHGSGVHRLEFSGATPTACHVEGSSGH